MQRLSSNDYFSRRVFQKIMPIVIAAQTKKKRKKSSVLIANDVIAEERVKGV